MALYAGCTLADGVMPGFYENPGLDPNRSTVSYNYDEHVDPFNGMLQLHHVDMVIPGNGGFDLKLQRSYFGPTAQFRSISDTMYYNRTPNVGVGWNLLIGGRVFGAIGAGGACSGGQQMSFETPDGRRQGLIRRMDGTFLSPARWRGICVVGGVHVFAPNGTRYEMTQAITEVIPGTIQNAPFLYPTKIEDRNGNAATFAYGVLAGSPSLSEIETSDGRRLTFSYAQLGGVHVLSTVSDGVRNWHYRYKPEPVFVEPVSGIGMAYFLERVDPPSGGPWVYNYYPCSYAGPGACGMGMVDYPEGGRLVYEYQLVDFDDGSGDTPVVSKRTVSGAAMLAEDSNSVWTYAYSPGSPGVNATTTVTSGAGKLVYRHVGYATVSSGSMWQVGLLQEKRIQTSSGFDLEVETSTWDKQQISSYPTLRRFGQHDGATYAPLLTERKISRSGATYTTTYSDFDQYGNPQAIVEAGQRMRTTARSYFTDESKWILGIPADETISGLGSIDRSFDSRGNLLGETRFGVSTSFTYSSLGDLTSRTDARGNTTHYSLHFRGVPLQEARPESVVISRSVDTFGNVTSQSDGAGNVYSYEYDALRRLVRKAPPMGAATHVSWTGSVARTATRGPFVQSTHFDGIGLPYLVRTDGVPVGYTYDILGRRTFESLPGRYNDNGDGTFSIGGTTTPRDMLGRATRVEHIDGTTRSISYSGAAAVSEINERGFTTVRHYAAFGDPDVRFLTAVNQPGGRTTAIGRNDLGQITSVTRDDKTRTYGYNAAFFLTSVIDPETGTTTYGRDEVGNMISRTMGARTTTYAYDGLNRLTTTTHPDGTVVTIAYLGNGKVQSVTSPSATRTYTYDANANLTSETLTVGGQVFTIGYAYDANDALASITYPRTGEVISYVPDNLGRPTRASPYIAGVSYFASGNPKEIFYASGVRMALEETIRQQPYRLKAGRTAAGIAAFLDKQYTYDPAGNVMGIRDSGDPAQSMQMTYDEADQLTEVTGPWGRSTITYDLGGNLKTYNMGILGTLVYHYGADNKLASVGSKSFAYDGYGNVASDGSHAYVYDDASNLECVDCGTANEIRYAYDGNNRRVSRAKGSEVTYYVHAANSDLLLEYTPLRSEAVQHVYLNGKRIASKRVAM